MGGGLGFSGKSISLERKEEKKRKGYAVWLVMLEERNKSTKSTGGGAK